MSFKYLFSKAFAFAPWRLHLAAHSHHLWPDVTFEAQAQYWRDSAKLADRKWDKVLGEVWPEAQGHVANELGLRSPSSVVFAPNTHALLIALFSAVGKRPIRVVATDEEFHSFRRQAARWTEAGEIVLTTVPVDPFDTFEERFSIAVHECDLIFVSHVFFKSGRVFGSAFDLAHHSRPEGPWLVVDGYHGFRAVPTDLWAVADRTFYLAGGYKYAMAGEGCAFLHAPEGFGPRPELTGWYAEFGDLEGPSDGVGYVRDAGRFMGATFDPSGLYRFNAVAKLLAQEGLTTASIAEHVAPLKAELLERLGECGRLAEAELLNPGSTARFLALRHPDAAAWRAALLEEDVVTDVRDDVMRIGFGLYHDPEDIDRFCALAGRTL